MPDDLHFKSRGQQLLRAWQGSSTGHAAALALELDDPTFCRILHGNRLPTLAQALRIDRVTKGAVYCQSWHEEPRASRLKRRAS